MAKRSIWAGLRRDEIDKLPEKDLHKLVKVAEQKRRRIEQSGVSQYLPIIEKFSLKKPIPPKMAYRASSFLDEPEVTIKTAKGIQKKLAEQGLYIDEKRVMRKIDDNSIVEGLTWERVTELIDKLRESPQVGEYWWQQIASDVVAYVESKVDSGMTFDEVYEVALKHAIDIINEKKQNAPKRTAGFRMGGR